MWYSLVPACCGTERGCDRSEVMAGTGASCYVGFQWTQGTSGMRRAREGQSSPVQVRVAGEMLRKDSRQRGVTVKVSYD